MKISNSLKLALALVSLAASFSSASAQDSKEDKKAAQAELITKIIKEQNYLFTAQSVTPTGGRYKQLTTDYFVRVSKDTIMADLPYFGKAYSAPIGSSDGGIHFTSTNFEYELADRKKGGWDISIKTKDIQDAQRFNFTIFDNGSASLQATSNNRQPISFSGYVSERKNKKSH